jgi:electron transport complex protein RnfG
VTSFTGRSLQNPSENGWNVKKNGGDFDQFTGATITPRAVVKQVYKVLQFVETHQKSLFTQAKLNNADKTPDAAEKANEQ